MLLLLQELIHSFRGFPQSRRQSRFFRDFDASLART
jgi:hypothetical protein